MPYQFKFEKVLTIREQEKEEAILVYEKAIKAFEEEATKLFELLRKKEELEEVQRTQLSSGTSVQIIRHHQQFLGNLLKSIHHQQEVVMRARTKMQYEEQRLIEKNIEVKKLEKMKEKDLSNFLNELDRLESKWMDELSMLQMANRGS